MTLTDELQKYASVRHARHAAPSNTKEVHLATADSLVRVLTDMVASIPPERRQAYWNALPPRQVATLWYDDAWGIAPSFHPVLAALVHLSKLVFQLRSLARHARTDARDASSEHVFAKMASFLTSHVKDQLLTGLWMHGCLHPPEVMTVSTTAALDNKDALFALAAEVSGLKLPLDAVA
jgi:hypothetical protein